METLITHDDLLRQLRYDAETGAFTWKVKSKKSSIGGGAGGVRPHGYEMIGLWYRRYYSHRLAWFYITGKWPAGQIDHINGDRSDNRFCNLRIATHSENQHNRGRQINNRSGAPGVHWANREQRWIAKIKINGKTRHIGAFIELSAAIAARQLAEQKFFGTFTRKGEAA